MRTVPMGPMGRGAPTAKTVLPERMAQMETAIETVMEIVQVLMVPESSKARTMQMHARGLTDTDAHLERMLSRVSWRPEQCHPQRS